MYSAWCWEALVSSLFYSSTINMHYLHPFTILTNALTGGHMGTYLGLFNGTICIPQIVAASLGGMILKMFTTAGNVAPEVNMLVLAGIFLIIGAGCVGIIKEKQ